MNRLAEVKAVLRALVISNANRMSMKQLDSDYKSTECEPIPYKQLGFASLEQFLRSISDTLQVQGTGAQAIVSFVPNAKTQHISDLVRKQKRSKGKRKPATVKVKSQQPQYRQQKNNSNANYNFQSDFQASQPANYQTLYGQHSHCATNSLQVVQYQLANFMQPYYQYQFANYAMNANFDAYYTQQSNRNAFASQNASAFAAHSKKRANNQRNTTQKVDLKSRMHKVLDAEVAKNAAADVKKSATVVQHPPPPEPVAKTVPKQELKPHCIIQTKQISKGTARKALIVAQSETIDIADAQDLPTDKPAPNTTIRIVINNDKWQPLVGNVSNSETSSLSPRTVANNEHGSLANKCQTAPNTPIRRLELTRQTASVMQSPKTFSGAEATTSPNLASRNVPIEMCLAEKISRITNMLNKSLQLSNASSSTSNFENTKATELLHKQRDNLVKSAFLNTSASDEDQPKDIDEAVPSFAVTRNVFRHDFPKGTVKSGTKIPHYELEGISCNAKLTVFVSKIHDLYRFWFQLIDEDNEFDDLTNRITYFYSYANPEEYRVYHMTISPGLICAIYFEGIWRRAEVITIVDAETVKVFFMDYGIVTEVLVESLMHLQLEFADLPAQALRGSLSHIRPIGMHWNLQSINKFASLVRDKIVRAKVAEIDKENETVYLIICDTNGREVIQVNTQLVKDGFAFFDKHWMSDYIEKNGGRCHNRREDYPTFAMLENGDYPALSELIDLMGKGIDYERITDRILYHPNNLSLSKNASDTVRDLPFHLLSSNPFRDDIVLDQIKNSVDISATNTLNESLRLMFTS